MKKYQTVFSTNGSQNSPIFFFLYRTVLGIYPLHIMINVGEVILLNKMDSLCVLQSYLYIYLKKKSVISRKRILLNQNHLDLISFSARKTRSQSYTPCQIMYRQRSISMVVWQGWWLPKCDAEGNFEGEQCDNTGKQSVSLAEYC